MGRQGIFLSPSFRTNLWHQKLLTDFDTTVFLGFTITYYLFSLLHRACCIEKPCHDKVSLSKKHQIHTQTDCNDKRPQTAQFYNERISTDLNLVT